MALILRFLSTLAALWLADRWVPGFNVIGGISGYLFAAIAITALNLILKPLLKLVSAPLIWLTLGLFSLVINLAIVYLAVSFLPYLSSSGWLALILTAVLLSLAELVSRGKI